MKLLVYTRIIKVLFSLLLLMSGDVELNPGPNPKEILMKYWAKLSKAISANVSNVANALFSKDLITRGTREYTLTALGPTSTDKATRLMIDVVDQLEASIDERQYLVKVCSVLTKQGAAIKEIGIIMLKELEEDTATVHPPLPQSGASEGKKLNLRTALRIFHSSAHHYRLIGTVLDVKVADLKLTEDVTSNLITVFERWFDANRNVSWDTLLELCDNFPDQLGKAKAHLNKFFPKIGENTSNFDNVIEVEPGTIKKWFDDEKEGWIDLTLTRVHMVGPAGSGKSCAQNLLLNEPPPKHLPCTTSSEDLLTCSDTPFSDPKILEHSSSNPQISSDTSQSSDPHASPDSMTDLHYNTTTSSSNTSSKSITDSTPIACKAVKALRVTSNDNETWNRITKDELLERLASSLKRAVAKFSQQKQATSTLSFSDESESDDEFTPEAPEGPRDYGTVVNEIVQCLSVAKAQLSEKWAYIIDSGGQPAFQELLPVFTRAASLNVITLDLSKGIDDEFEYTYRINGKEFKCDEKMKYSNRKVFNSVVSAASVQKPLDIPYLTKPSQEATFIHSMSFVLGTHYDVVIKNSKNEKEAFAQVKQMSDDLMKQLDSHSKKYIIPDVHEDSTCIIFLVDTLIKDRGERKRVSQEIFKIVDRSQTSLKVKIPIWLFVFELCLEKKAESNGGFVTREEADDEGKRLHMTPSDVEDALTYSTFTIAPLFYTILILNLN
ncbi:PREDICTED: uncharacterized protein LOC105313125 isoform X1 [Amphimedon queenslandica]|uniref:Death domain-containing protein n=1 Tax=Amphimedon queenslandica TaxID=400682 RepID=A0A1X7ULJ3_AMPQE|nr:PREDICTED: uncharacterized protein LOC105313125 isoform X1 [Amphimedon queenslandica]|eukprot:XP_019853370.1 PREDICTED: uncharacterized protein LOC105313125 isoform X1 [Amphimedon queenslandica]